jgi:hypothetical protein
LDGEPFLPDYDALLLDAVIVWERAPLEGLLPKSFVRAEVARFYGANGNQGVDPVILVKLMFLLFFDDVPSEREPMERPAAVASTDSRLADRGGAERENPAASRRPRDRKRGGGKMRPPRSDPQAGA